MFLKENVSIDAICVVYNWTIQNLYYILIIKFM